MIKTHEEKKLGRSAVLVPSVRGQKLREKSKKGSNQPTMTLFFTPWKINIENDGLKIWNLFFISTFLGGRFACSMSIFRAVVQFYPKSNPGTWIFN